MKLPALTLTLILSLAGPGLAQDQRAHFNDIRAQEQNDPAAAFAAMTRLAESGYAPALDRMGYYFRTGIGSQENLRTARHWYEQAVAAGHPWSTASLARVEIKLGHGEAALKLLQAAEREGLPGTQRLLATAHVDRQLGKASDLILGRKMLESLAAQGDKNAARDLVVRSNWGRLTGQVSAAAIGTVVQVGLEGDARSAEAALVYLSRVSDKREASLQTRAALADVQGVRDRVLSVERIRLAAEQTPRQFWTKVEAILSDTETPNYARAATTAFWINKNSWVRVLQKELGSLGYYHGSVNARMTARTIRAQNQFCRDREIWNICASGPLRGPTVRAVASEIAALKEG